MSEIKIVFLYFLTFKIKTINVCMLFKIKYHAVGDSWWQLLLLYGNCVWPI